MFRRGFRRGAMRRAMQPNVPPMLRRAHELLAAENYPAAAEAFEKLASAGEARGHPKTAQMCLQAGRARILAGQKETGCAHLKRGLGLMAGQPVRLRRAGERVVRELNERGMTAESREIEKWLAAAIPASPTETRMGEAPAKKPMLPTKCPECGGVIRADDAEWIDEITAECDWCGSPVRAA